MLPKHAIAILPNDHDTFCEGTCGMNGQSSPLLISIIIPCYNGERFLAASIDTVLDQTYEFKEVIVVDDGSIDTSPAIMATYGERIRVVRQANAGLPAARNAGIRIASGELFAFLDADDYWTPDFLEKMVQAIDASGAGIAYCGWQNVGLPGARGEPFIPPDYQAMPDKVELLIGGPRWPVHAAIVRRDVVAEVGGFDTKWKNCEDFAFWIRTATRHKLVCVPEVLAFYRFHGEQMTRHRDRIAINHFLVQLEFIGQNKLLARALGKEKARTLIWDALLQKGNALYWQGDLVAARSIFRTVMRHGYLKMQDLPRMLPSLLPFWLHRVIRDTKERVGG